MYLSTKTLLSNDTLKFKHKISSLIKNSNDLKTKTKFSMQHKIWSLNTKLRVKAQSFESIGTQNFGLKSNKFGLKHRIKELKRTISIAF